MNQKRELSFAHLGTHAPFARGEVLERQKHSIELSTEYRAWSPVIEWCRTNIPKGVLWSRHRNRETGRIELTFSDATTAMLALLTLG